jgi:hypothetical protein
MLSKSLFWNADGTFHTASRYFMQLYTILAYFYDRDFVFPSGDERPWVSKHITCVWAFMKRRREKDYLAVFNALKNAANSFGFDLTPKTVMIDFEKAASNAFEKTFPDILVKGCLWHFGRSIFKYVFNLYLFITHKFILKNDIINPYIL